MATVEEPSKKMPLPIAARERGPGPGRYALPSTCGFIEHDCTRNTKPAYSFGRVTTEALKGRSPGPAYFIDPAVTRHGKDGTPAYSMLARQGDLGIFKTPSPGAYSPEKVHPQGERHAPQYSMSNRTRYRRHDNNPAPNKYCLPPVLGSRQANMQSSYSYSMTGRSNIGSYLEDLAKCPGPGQYNGTGPDLYKTKAPLYTLRSRNYMPGDSTQKPGPGAHCPERVNINKPMMPKHSLGIRHSEFVCPLFMDV